MLSIEFFYLNINNLRFLWGLVDINASLRKIIGGGNLTSCYTDLELLKVNVKQGKSLN